MYLKFNKKNKKKQIANIGESSGQPVLCNETGIAFLSMAKASAYYSCDLYGYFRNNKEYCGQLSDGTKLTWTKITKEQYENIKSRAS